MSDADLGRRGKNSGAATEAEEDHHPTQEEESEALGLLRMEARLWLVLEFGSDMELDRLWDLPDWEGLESMVTILLEPLLLLLWLMYWRGSEFAELTRSELDKPCGLVAWE